MSLFSRFLGRKDVNDLARRPLVANPDIKNPLSLQVLFADAHRFDADRLLYAVNFIATFFPTGAFPGRYPKCRSTPAAPRQT